MAKGTITLSGSTVGTKMESLEVEQGATGAVNGLFKVDNNDTDKIAMSIEAANIDADVMDITMDAVTTARGIDITADGLTTGSALYIDSDSSSTGTRSIANIIQNHASASGSTVLRLQQDGTGDIVNFFDGGTEVFTVIDGGKVGIGTTAPDGLLHVFESATTHGINAGADNFIIEGTGVIGMTFASDADMSIAFSDNNASYSGRIMYDISERDLTFWTNELQRVTITDDGKVGIGTITPSEMVQITGTNANISIEKYATSGAGPGLTLRLSDHGTVGTHNAVESGDILGTLAWAGSTGSYFENSMQIRGVASETFSGTAAGGRLSFHTTDNGTQTVDERMTILHNGRVGIGTTAPGTPLEVNVSGNANPSIQVKTTGTNKLKLVTTAGGGTSGAIGYFLENGDDDQWFMGIQDASGGLWFIDNSSGQSSRRPLCIKKGGGVGMGTTDPSSILETYANHSGGWAGRFRNDGDNVDRYGLRVQCGNNGTSGTTLFMHAYTNDGNITGYLRENSSGVFQVDDTSDEKLKENIVDSKIKGIEIINQIKIRDFDWKHNGAHQVGGLIAQELQPLIPFAVTEHMEKGEPILCIARDSIITTLVKACQDLSEKVTALENA